MDVLLAELLEDLQLDRLDVLVGLYAEVAEGNHLAHRGVQSEAQGVRDGMVHVEEIGLEIFAELHVVAVLHHLEVELGGIHEFLMALLHHHLGEVRGVDHGVADLLDDVMDGRDVIVVAVGQEDGADLMLVLLEIGRVRDDVVDARRVLLRELDADVDNDDLILILVEGAVAADLLQAAKRHETQDVLAWLYLGHGLAAIHQFRQGFGVAARGGAGDGHTAAVAASGRTAGAGASAGGTAAVAGTVGPARGFIWHVYWLFLI